jgi:hypothetical protein
MIQAKRIIQAILVRTGEEYEYMKYRQYVDINEEFSYPSMLLSGHLGIMLGYLSDSR